MAAFLGQHFLRSEKIVRKIVEAAEIQKNDIILEVGPGRGVLTEELLKRAKTVLAVEKDKKLINFLAEKFSPEIKQGHLLLIEGDILKLQRGCSAQVGRAKRRSQSPQRGDCSSLLGLALSPSAKTMPARPPQRFSPRHNLRLILSKKYKIVANIPYYITSRFLRNFLTAKNQPQKMVLMVQKEVAERICIKSHEVRPPREVAPPKMNLLAISVQVYAEPKILFHLSKKYFSPQPKVDSAVIAISNISRKFFDFSRLRLSESLITALGEPYDKYVQNEKEFFQLVKAGFAQKRKLLINNLTKFEKKSKGTRESRTFSGVLVSRGKVRDKEKMGMEKIFQKCEIPLKSRAENLSLSDWKCLYQCCEIHFR